MLTLFTTPKPFLGHIGLIQRNALESWRRLNPGAEIILFGDEEGAAKAARDLGLMHHPDVRRGPQGTKFLDFLFLQAQRLARYEALCYANCDIILPSTLLQSIETVKQKHRKFLLTGRRWDLDVREPLDFASLDWEQRLVERGRAGGSQRPPQWIDYFAFSRGLFREIPPLVIGRIGWDNWLVWYARTQRAAVVDASATVTAVHQNHDYSYHPQGEVGVWHDEHARRNIELAGGWSHLYTIEDATHTLGPQGLRRRFRHHFVPAWRAVRRVEYAATSRLLRATRPLRHAVGLRKENFSWLLRRKDSPESS